VYQLLSFLIVILLTLAGCTSTPERVETTAEDTLSPAAQTYIDQGDYLSAAQLYISAAKTASENQQIALHLSAAELLARGELWQQLTPVLASLDPSSLDPTQQVRYLLLDAEHALAEHQPELALERLQEISNPESMPDFGKNYYQIRAEAYAMTGNAMEAARQLIWLDGLIDEPAQKLANQYRIWEQFSNLSDDALQQLRTSPPPDPLSGWMELVLLTRQNARDLKRWNAALDGWHLRYPEHSAATTLLPDLLQQVGQFGARARHIGVLLPLSGATADSAMAIRDGIMAAYYQDPLEQPELRFYDTGGSAQMLWSVYQNAIQEGAEFVIGPLLKDSIQQLARSGDLPVPVLALNQISNKQTGLPLYQYGLAPEDEARQVAEKMINDGKRQVIALVPDTAWGSRVLTAFEQQFISLGGEILTSGQYAPDSADFKSPIQRTLNLDSSKNRLSALERLLGKKLNFEPRRRQDVDAIFVLGFPRQARQLKPQLRFHHAGDIPIYSTSHVFAASPDPSLDRDMDGLFFCDIPWVLDYEGRWSQQREQLLAAWPIRSQRFQRLFALGYDAYQVSPWLESLNMPGFAYFPGATGILTLDENKQLHRTLEWAQFRKGRPQQILPREGQYEPEGNWRPR
jgi:outer membrane PBP1 activator LpoA protein